MKSILCFLCTVIFLFAIPNAWGQRKDYQLFQTIQLSTEASVATCFLQDKQGLIWIGSNKGLFSFDGYRATPHFEVEQPTNSWIYTGVVVADRYLYLGADNGILIFDTESDRYVEKGIPFPTDIRSLALQEKLLWIGTLNGLYAYHLDSEELERWEATPQSGLPHNTIYTILPTSTGELYVGTYNGLCKYNRSDRTFTPISLSKERHPTNTFINSLVEDQSNHILWIGTEGRLLRYNLNSEEVEHVGAVEANSVKSLAIDGNGTLLIGTDNGLYSYQEGEVPLHILHDSRNHQSLVNNTIWTIFQDKDKNSWFGTNYGISLVNVNAPFHYTPLFQLTNSGEGNQFFSLFKDSKGFYWFGGSNGLLRFKQGDSPTQVRWYKMDNPTYPLSHNRIRHIYEDSEKELWIATDGSISRYNYSTEQFINYQITDATQMHNSNWAYNLIEDRQGKLWVASCLGGIFIVDKEKLKEHSSKPFIAETNLHVENGLSGAFINQLVSDKEGNIWALLYQNGINRIAPTTYKVSSLETDSYTAGRKPNFLLADKEGSLWIGFRGGVLKVEPTTLKIESVWFDQFSNDEIFYMEEVENEIWISTSNEGWIVDKELLTTHRWGTTEKSFNCIYYDATAKVVFLGENDGFSTTTPNLLRTPYPESVIVPTSFYVNGESYTLPTSIRYQQQIELTHKENNIVIEFTDFPYSLHEKSQFIYRIKEDHSGWNTLPIQSNRIVYNNLQPGNYTLEVSRLDGDALQSAKVYTLNLLIHPPAYYSWWAKLIYLLLLIGAILWVINFFRIKTRLQLERMEKEQIKEQARQKMELFTHLSHDFKTPLSLVISPLSKRMSETVNAQELKFLEGVWRNAMKLNALIHQTLDFSRIEHNDQALLILSQTEIVSFANSIFESYREVAQERAIRTHFTTNIERLEVEIDRIKWQSILDNLLSNALKYTPAGKSITLSLYLEEDSSTLRICLADEGIGIPEQEIPYIFQRFYQASHTRGKKEGTGIGLYLVKSYAELHQAHVTVQSTLHKGSTFTLTLPIQQAAREEQHTKQPLQWMEESSIEVEQEEVKKSVEGAYEEQQPLILLVEDNPEVMNFIEEVLSPHYRCIKAIDGKEGLSSCKEMLPDLVVTDLMMPQMDGMEMCKELKKYIPTSTIPIIMLTAQGDSTTELASMQQQIDAFISKPFDPVILISRIRQLVKRKKTEEAQLRIEKITKPKEMETISHDERFLKEVTQIIEERIDDADLNVTALCELAAVSNKHLYRKIKQLTGQTPVDYIRSIRLKKAAMLLRQKKFSISEVMYMVGFSSSSYFSKCFQAAFGVTPKQFIEKG